MANTKSAKKRVITNEKRRVRNVARRSDMKTACKKVLSALSNSDAEKAVNLLKDAIAKIARAKNKGLVKANTAKRKISRLSKRVAAAVRA